MMRKSELEIMLKHFYENEDFGYGKEITNEEFKKYLAIEDENSWDFRGPVLSFRIYLEEKGYFTKQEDDVLRVLSLDEMADKCLKNMDRIERYQKRNVTCMLKAKTGELNQFDRKVHELSLQKAINCLHAMKSVLTKYL